MKKEKFFKFYFSNVQIKIMIENEIYCYINGFLKWNNSNKTSYMQETRHFLERFAFLI